MIKIFITKEETSDIGEYAEHIGYIELCDDGDAIVSITKEIKLERIKYRWLTAVTVVQFGDLFSFPHELLSLRKVKDNWFISVAAEAPLKTINIVREIKDQKLNKEISKWVINQVYSN